MVTAVEIIGIVIVCKGIFFLIKPNALKRLMAFAGQGRRLYVAGFLRLLIGGALLFAASQCKLPEVIIVLGILFLAGGIAIFAIPIEKIKFMVDWFNKKSLLALRFLGLAPLAIGVLLIYSA